MPIPSPGDFIHLRKLAVAPDALLPAAAWSEIKLGQLGPSGQSLPVAYEIEGELLAPIVVGSSITVRRTVRNGERVEGLFISSPVTAILGDRILTSNSVYKITTLPPAL